MGVRAFLGPQWRESLSLDPDDRIRVNAVPSERIYLIYDAIFSILSTFSAYMHVPPHK
jgi:hypothetical protein